MFRTLRSVSYTCAALAALTARTSAQAPRDTTTVLDSVAQQVVQLGARHGESIWPGFRPDTIPVAFVLRGRGTLLLNWPGAVPAEFSAVSGVSKAGWRDEGAVAAASTSVQIGGRRVAQVALSPTDGLDQALLVATALHEAFHVWQGAQARPGRRFGAGENSMLTSSYPVFETENELRFDLEGKLLAAALDAKTAAARRDLAQQFVGVRRARHARLATEYAVFDQMSELNEGLAEYVLIRALQLIEAEGPAAWRPSARRQLAELKTALADLTGAESLSFRLRYYRTGPAIGLLLDHLAGARWKSELLRHDRTLQDALASASGIDAALEAAQNRAHKNFNVAQAQSAAEQRIVRLQATRKAKADSILGLPGIHLILRSDSLPVAQFNSCGFDPQNILPISATARIHMRWWRPCAGGPTYAEFSVPSVQDQQAGTISAVIGNESDLRITAAGSVVSLRDGEVLRDLPSVKLEAPRASVEAVRADISRTGNTITIWPKGPRS